jgi:hypothetical protein
MADKSTTMPIGTCEDVPVQVAKNCLILTDFVVLEIPEDDNMSIILGRPFLNTAGSGVRRFSQKQFRYSTTTRNHDSEPETPFWHPAGTGIRRRSSSSSSSSSPTSLHQPSMITPSMCE